MENRAVAVFVDGRSFFYQTKDLTADTDGVLSYDTFGRKLAEAAYEGKDFTYHGLTYMTSVTSAADSTLRFLQEIAKENGVYTITSERGNVARKCSSCDDLSRFMVDSTHYVQFTVEVLRQVDKHKLNGVVLIVADKAWSPLVRNLKDRGVRVTIACVGSPDRFVSRRLREDAWSTIEFSGQLFSSLKKKRTTPRPRDDDDDPFEGGNPSPSGRFVYLNDEIEITEEMLDEFVYELSLAEEKMKNGFVGRSFFLTRWKSSGMNLPIRPKDRLRLLHALVEEGEVEEYQAPCGTAAIRLTPVDEQEVEEQPESALADAS